MMTNRRKITRAVLTVSLLFGIYIAASTPTHAAATYCDSILTQRYILDIPVGEVGDPYLNYNDIGLYGVSVRKFCDPKTQILDVCKYKSVSDPGPGVSVTKIEGENRHVWYDVPAMKYDSSKHVDVQLTPQDKDGQSWATAVSTGSSADDGRPMKYTVKYQLRKDCKIVGFTVQDGLASGSLQRKYAVSQKICARLKGYRTAYEKYLEDASDSIFAVEPPKSVIPSEETIAQIVKEVGGKFERMQTAEAWSAVYHSCKVLASDFGEPLPAASSASAAGMKGRKGSTKQSLH